MTVELTQELLKTQLHYDPETGVFTWLVKRGAADVGAVAGCIAGGGYINIALLGKQYRAHRLAWLYMTGVWPPNLIDHEDTDRANNRFANLREATQSQNQLNSKRKATNTSGVKGVSWHPEQKKWHAQLKLNGKKHHLGAFRTIEEAEAAVRALRPSLHGKYANQGDQR